MAALVEFPPTSYPVALFVGAAPAFTCANICFNVIKDAVSCIKGHLMCRGCADGWKQRSETCPVCSVKLDVLVPIRDLNDAVAAAVVMCFTRLDANGNVLDDENDEPAAAAAAASSSSSSSSSSASAAGGKRKAAGGGGHCGKGAKKAKVDRCEWTGKLQDGPDHFKTCPYAGVRCPHEGCNALVARRDLPAHKQSCQHGTRLCRWAGCGATLVFAALAAHEGACVKREVGCPNNGCNASRIAFDVLVAHRRTCLHETVPCPFAGMGCKSRMPRKDVEAHKKAFMEYHNDLLQRMPIKTYRARKAKKAAVKRCASVRSLYLQKLN